MIRPSLENCPTYFVILAFFVLGLLCFGQTHQYPFVHDDVYFIVENPHINSLDVAEIFRKKTFDTSRHAIINTYYRPVVEVLHRFQYRLFGLEAGYYHLFNVFVHIINAALLFVLLQRWLPLPRIGPFLIALLFLIHPVQTEAVACISGISNLLFTFLSLLILLFYTKGKKGLVFSCVLLLICLLVKEQAVVVPFLIAAKEWIFLNPRKRNAFPWKTVGLLLGVLVLYFFWRIFIFGSSLISLADSSDEFYLRILSIPRSILIYLKVLFFPTDLHYYRSLDILLPFAKPLLLVLILGAICFLIGYRLKGDDRKMFLFGFAWFLVTLAPMLNIIPLVNEYSQILIFEHFLYLPMVGIGIVCAVCVKALIQREVLSQRSGIVLLCVFLVLLCSLTVKQNAYWRGEIPLFERTLRYESSARVHQLLAKAYFKRKNFDQARDNYEKSLSIMIFYRDKVKDLKVKKFYESIIYENHYDLGHTFDQLGQYYRSIDHFQAALALEEDRPETHSNLAVQLARIGRFQLAVSHFQRAISLDPENTNLHNNLAVCYIHQGQRKKARKVLENVLTLDLQNVIARQYLLQLDSEEKLDRNSMNPYNKK